MGDRGSEFNQGPAIDIDSRDTLGSLDEGRLSRTGITRKIRERTPLFFLQFCCHF
jgi:hypothetical protein